MAKTRRHTPRSRAELRLGLYFLHRGCIRRPKSERLDEGYDAYKKGWEVRLVVDSSEELTDVRRALQTVGLEQGRPYAKSRKWVQPVYGRRAVESFEQWAKKAERSMSVRG